MEEKMEEIESERITSAKEMVETHRKSLINKPKEPDFKSWLGGRDYPLEWMKEQFGETLTEKDGLNHFGGRFDGADCNICGKEVKSDEKIIQLSFSFCREYGCGMNICKDCLVRLNKLLLKSQISKNGGNKK